MFLMQFTLEWEAPPRPNGAVLRYDIWIRRIDILKNKTVSVTSSCMYDQSTSQT